MRFDLIDESALPEPLVETDEPMGFTGLRVRSDDFYGLWPKNKEAALRGVPELQRCLDELIKYSGFPVTEKVTSELIKASNDLFVHLSRACAVVDEQGEPHPKIEKGVIVTNHTEWIEFLAKRLAQPGVLK